MTERVVTVTEFRANSLALFDEVEKQGQQITITRRGRAVAVIGPPQALGKAPKKAKWKSPANSWAGKIEIVGDIVNYDSSHLWDCMSEKPFGVGD